MLNGRNGIENNFRAFSRRDDTYFDSTRFDTLQRTWNRINDEIYTVVMTTRTRGETPKNYFHREVVMYLYRRRRIIETGQNRHLAVVVATVFFSVLFLFRFVHWQSREEDCARRRVFTLHHNSVDK